MLCDDLEGWDGGRVGGRPTRKVIHIYMYFKVLYSRNQHNIVKK